MKRIAMAVILLMNAFLQTAQSVDDFWESDQKHVRVLCLSSGFINDLSRPDCNTQEKRHYTCSAWANFFRASVGTPKNILFIPDAKVVEENALEDIFGKGWPAEWSELTERVQFLVKDFGLHFIVYGKGDPGAFLNNVDGVFVWGGNTFQLQDRLLATGLHESLQKAVLEKGIPYLGGSAGTNVATKTICTTNDMMVVEPFEFDGMGFLPFSVNVHYCAGAMYYKNEMDEYVEYGGETRDERLQQFLMANMEQCPYIVLLPEGRAIERYDNTLKILGAHALDVATYDAFQKTLVKTAMDAEALTQYVFHDNNALNA